MRVAAQATPMPHAGNLVLHRVTHESPDRVTISFWTVNVLDIAFQRAGRLVSCALYELEDMYYTCDLGGGQQLTLQNAGSQTYIGFRSLRPGQQQSQQLGIKTGAWTGKPVALRSDGGLILKFETANGPLAFGIHEDQITRLLQPPETKNMEELPLQKSVDESGVGRGEPMQPMRPMEPIPPMEPMKPMEMKMGNMSMRMGEESHAIGEPVRKKFCTQCGSALGSGDQYCGNCGKKV